jgi:hypothetical protein
MKAVLKEDRFPQPHLKVFDYTRTPGRKWAKMLADANANHILPIPVDGRYVPANCGL